MKKLTFTLVAGIACTLALGLFATAQDKAAAPASQELKIGIVDMTKVFGEYYKTKDAEKRVNEDKSMAKKELDERAARYRDLMQRWNDRQKTINDKLVNEELRAGAQREASEVAAEIKSLEREMEEFRRRREGQLQEQVFRMRKGLLDDIKEKVENMAKRDNYDIVFDKSSKSPSGVYFLLFSKDAIDFTDGVLKVLNASSDGK